MPRHDVPTPPDPPPFDRRLAPSPQQFVAAAVLVIVVGAAAFGLLGHDAGAVMREGSRLRMQVTFPERTRQGIPVALAVEIENVGESMIETVTVRFDRDYLDGFRIESVTPEIARLTATTYEVDLRALEDGAVRRVVLAARSEAFGGRRGVVEATTVGETLRAVVSTFVFP